MNRFRRILFPLLCLPAACLWLTSAGAQQVDPAMLQKAKSMGFSPTEIEALKATQQSQTGTSARPGTQSRPGLDTSRRWNLTPEQLDQINPAQLEKLISDKIDQQGQVQDVRGKRPQAQPGTANLTQDVGEFVDVKELPYEKQQPIEYEIVLKDGQYIKRALPVVFGREVFSSRNLTFAPNYNLATPVDYVLGPGDEVIVEAWGASETYSKQKVTPDGTITLQGIGPVTVAGLTMAEAGGRIGGKVSQIMGGTQSRVTLGQIRSIKVNIAGEVMVPGTYTLPSLATVFNAIYSAGGVNKIGSLRDIKVYRNNRQIATLDVYDYLIHGRYTANVRLEDNDMIIVPPYESYVTMTGKIKRERVYELKKGESLSQAIEYAGGFTGDSYTDNINVRRKTGRQYSILTVEEADYSSFPMYDGDSVVVDKIIADYANRLTISGAVWRPGDYQLSESLSTLTELIAKAEGLRGDEFGSRGQITRRKSDFTYEVIPFDVRTAATGAQQIELMKEDSVYIPNILELREDFRIVVKGEVNRPDTIAYRDGMTVEDAILRTGGLKESASYAKIEVARRIKDPNSTTYTSRTADLQVFSITGDLAIAPAAQRFVLQPFDEIFIRRSPGYNEQQNVTLNGEVLYPGEYVLATAGDRISDVILKAGGITPEAYVKGASVKRKMTEDEQARMESLLRIARSDRGRDSLSSSLLSSSTEAVYPIGVNVEQALMKPGCNEDIILHDGDQVFVPKYNSTVRISGSVLYPNSVTFNKSSVKSYIIQAGGYTDMARKRPFVIYMNGKVAATRAGLFGKSYPKVEPGSEVVVPMKVPRNGNTLSAVMGMMSSTASMAAMVASIINLTK